MKKEKRRSNETVYKINAHVILLRNESFTNMHFNSLNPLISNVWTYLFLEWHNLILIWH
jgi:hypothetical protein